MRRRIWLLLFATCGFSAGCGPAADTPAGRCAAVVRIHSSLQGGVALVGPPREEPDGSVAIEYEGTGAMNLPLRGSAQCSFATGPQGDLSLQEAIVDGIPLSEDEINAVRGKLQGET